MACSSKGQNALCHRHPQDFDPQWEIDTMWVIMFSYQKKSIYLKLAMTCQKQKLLYLKYDSMFTRRDRIKKSILCGTTIRLKIIIIISFAMSIQIKKTICNNVVERIDLMIISNFNNIFKNNYSYTHKGILKQIKLFLLLFHAKY